LKIISINHYILFLYVSILNIVYGIFPYSIILFLFSVLMLLNKNKYYIFLLPFILYPFQYLIRAQSPENIFLILLPELSILISIISYLLVKGINLSKFNIKYSSVLVLYIMLTAVVYIHHCPDFFYYPILFRQYILPIIFLLIFINISSFFNLARSALKLSFFSYSIISILILLNISKIININPSNESLYPFLGFSGDWFDPSYSDRLLFGSVSLPRINLFMGGAIGSAAAIFVALGLVPFMKSFEFTKLPYKLAGSSLILTGLFTLSFSTLIPICLFLIMLSFNKKYFKLVFPFLFICILYILNLELFINKSIMVYFYETSLSEFVAFFGSMSLTNLLFGVGPRIIANGYYFIPENFIVDVGIFRVFIETGVFNFLLFLSTLFIVFHRCFYILKHTDGVAFYFVIFLFLIFISLVHANFTAFPPFFPLYVAIVAVIFDTFKNLTSLNYK
jgi:hypothetical protein